jgi:L-threonylcarbamoyladenylate synthase
MVQTRVRIDAARPAPAALAEAVRVVRSGGVIAYPTEHLYALGCDPQNPAAVRRLAALKGTEGPKPLLLAIADRTEVARWAARVPPEAEALLAAWPEGLTVVLPARAGVIPELTGGGATIALRLVRAPLPAALVRAAGGALPATSANPAGAPATGDPDAVAAALPDLGLLLDAGMLPPGGPSTLLDVTAVPWRILRPGSVSRNAIAAFGPIAEA